MQALVELLMPVLKQREHLLGRRVVGAIRRDRVAPVTPATTPDQPQQTQHRGDDENRQKDKRDGATEVGERIEQGVFERRKRSVRIALTGLVGRQLTHAAVGKPSCEHCEHQRAERNHQPPANRRRLPTCHRGRLLKEDGHVRQPSYGESPSPVASSPVANPTSEDLARMSGYTPWCSGTRAACGRLPRARGGGAPKGIRQQDFALVLPLVDLKPLASVPDRAAGHDRLASARREDPVTAHAASFPRDARAGADPVCLHYRRGRDAGAVPRRRCAGHSGSAL